MEISKIIMKENNLNSLSKNFLRFIYVLIFSMSLGFILTSYFSIQGSLSGLYSQFVKQEVNLLSSSFREVLKTKIRTMEDHAGLPLIINTVMQPEADHSFLKDFMLDLQVQGRKASFFLADIDGNLIQSSGELSQNSENFEKRRNEFIKIANGEMEQYVEIFDLKGSILTLIAVPVQYNGHPEGTLVGILSSNIGDLLTSLTQDRLVSGKISSNGNVFYKFGTDRKEDSVVKKLKMPLINGQLELVIYKTEINKTILQLIKTVLIVVLLISLFFILIFKKLGLKLIVEPQKLIEESRLKVIALNKRLNTSLTRQNLALVASNVGVWDWDLATNNLVWDKQMYHIFGIKEEDFEGAYSSWESGLHPEDKEKSVAELEKAIEENSKFDTEFRIFWPSGEVRNIRALASLITDENDKPLRMVGINWDVTQESEQKRKLELANEELSQFSYRTSHDLKAPLITLKGLAKYIQQDIDDEEYDEVKKNASAIEAQAMKLERLVTDILNLAKADLEIQNSEKVEIKELTSEIKEKLKGIYLDNDVKIETNFNHNHDLNASKTRITQILENLISNSIKYSDPEKEKRFVKISTSSTEKFFVIKVEDNGLGIPKEYQDRIFNMFERFHQGISFGSGLGMYIVKKHIDKMQATINMTSSGEGTTFDIKINRNT